MEWLSKAEREAEMDRVMEEQFRDDPIIQAAVYAAVYAEVERRYPELVARYRERMRRAEWDE
jgi:hypothetical protein